MLLKELQLHNFRQYIGDQKVVFSTDPKKNVTLLKGKNTSGKTTFVQAFRWVLYENSDFTGSGRNSTKLLNDKVRKSMRAGDVETVSASIILVHQGKEYMFTRSLDYRSKESGDASPDNSSKFIISAQEGGEFRPSYIEVDSILPADLSEYFFFDGEKIASSTEKKNVEQSINTIMGLTPLKQMVDHLNPESTKSVYSALDSRRQDDPTGSLIPLKNTLNQYKRSLETSQEKYTTEETQLNILRDKWKEVSLKFAQIENTADLQDRLGEVDGEIEEKERQQKVATDKLITSFAPSIMEQYTAHIAEQLIDQLKSFNIADKGIPDITATTIKYLIERNKCACGCDLSKNEAAKIELQNLLSFVPPESIGSQIKQLGNDLGYYADSTLAASSFKINDDNFNNISKRLLELNNERGHLIYQIGDQGSDAQSIKDEYVNVERMMKDSEKNLIKLGGQVQSWRKEVTKIENEIQRISGLTGINAKLDQELMYVRALYLKAQKDYSEGSKDILAKMRETLQDVFSSMYHGNRTITLGDDYKITDSSHLDDSKGLSTVKNFAFITTLLKVARDRMDSENGLGAEPYPLVMDAVFSNTDKTHIRNISHELPTMAEQAILALMEKDWEVAKPTLSEYVGKIYLIDKKAEDETYIKEVTLNDA